MRTLKLSFLLLTLTVAPAVSALAATPGTIALVQYNADAHFGDIEANTKNLTRFAEEAVKHGANIVVFPETSTAGYDSGREIWCTPGKSRSSVDGKDKGCRDVRQVAEAFPSGPTTQYWTKFAQEKNLFVVFSVIEKLDGVFFNTVVAASPEGKLVKYSKRALYDTDKAYATPGSGPAVLETPYGRFGLLICMDGLDAGDEEGEEDYNFGFYAEYRRLGVNAIIIPMDFDDQNPNISETSAKKVFQEKATSQHLDLYAADHSPWDGTGKYRASGGERERRGLPASAIGRDGISYHQLRY